MKMEPVRKKGKTVKSCLNMTAIFIWSVLAVVFLSVMNVSHRRFTLNKTVVDLAKSHVYHNTVSCLSLYRYQDPPDLLIS